MGLSPFTCIAGVEHVIGAACLQSSLQPGLRKGILLKIISIKISKQETTKVKQSTGMGIFGDGRSFAKA